MRKHGGTPSRRDKHVTPTAISPPGVARRRFVGGQQSGLAGCKPPPVFTRGASSCSSQGRRQGEPRGASPRPSAPTYPPTYLVCALLRRAGVGALVGRDPRGSRQLGALGRAVCRFSRTPPPPPRRGLFWGRGGVPSAPGGRRVTPVALKLGGVREGGGGGALPPPAPPPLRASACHPLTLARPPGVYSCRGGCRAAVGVRRGPVGRQWVSAAGGGGGNPSRPGSCPRLPQPGL